MSDLRHDPIQKRWVIIAPERGLRPNTFYQIPVDSNDAGEEDFCPFCEGNEDKTPSEILAYRQTDKPKNGPGWRIRVVPNKYPALRIEGNLERKGIGYYDAMRGIGAHEVIIETPFHDEDIADMSISNIAKIFRAFKERTIDLSKDSRFRYVLGFKNFGKTAGSTLDHPHSQIIALPVTPRTVSMELNSAKEHFQLKERCLFCDIIQYEIETGDRIIKVTEDYIGYTPYASRFPFEILIAPVKHSHDYIQTEDSKLLSLAELLKDILMRLRKALNNPPYNLIIHNSPNIKGSKKRSHYWETIEHDWHWHIELTPKIVPIAGFEWGTGFYINPVSPEEAAKYLREIEIY